jgi:ABC-2 type transport system ATP-binding protein
VPAVLVESLVIRYGDLTAVDGLSLSADAGAVTVVLGPNGAGKTSTIEALEGYRRPASGTVRVLGLDPVAQRTSLNRRIGVMLQEGGIHPAMRPREALRLHAAYHDDPLDPEALLGRVGLRDRARTAYRHLSGGEQQRLSLALALVGRPSVAFLDEPTAGVDVGGRRLIRAVVRELAADGVCVLVATHDLAEAEKVADQVVIIDAGKVVASGSPADLMAGAGGEEIRFGAPPGLDVAALGERLGATATEASPGEYVVAAPPSPRNVATVTGWLADHDQPLADLRAGRGSLEDVFLRLTRDDQARGDTTTRGRATGAAGS